MCAHEPDLTVLEGIPAAEGAYVLAIALDRAISVRAGRRAGSLPPGLYAYAGSARGPGGLRARIARHLRPNKRRHWHVDQLTAAGRIEAVATSQHKGECALATELAGQTGATIPIPGFGSSDCRTCVSHLIRLPDTISPLSVITSDPRLVYLCLSPPHESRGYS